MTHPYRTTALPPARPLAWLARLVPPSMEWLASEWRWYRRAIGGEWVLRCAMLVPGAPEAWMRPRSIPSGVDVDREVWP